MPKYKVTGTMTDEGGVHISFSFPFDANNDAEAWKKIYSEYSNLENPILIEVRNVPRP